MRRYLIHLSYFGTRYRGMQKQNFGGDYTYKDPHTISGCLELALKTLEPINYPRVFSSSRTDKGVHALSNTIHVDLEADQNTINSHSITTNVNKFFDFNGHDIRILKTQQVQDDFHCRFSAYERQYLYRFAVPRPNISFRQKQEIPSPLTEHFRCLFLQTPEFDSEAVKSACNIFVGHHDFRALCSNSKHFTDKEVITERTCNSFNLVPATPFISNTKLAEEYDFWHLTCSSKSFLYHQVRRMVSVMLIYGQGKATLSDVQRLIDEPVDSSWAPFGTLFAAPHGLYLVDVLYHPEDLLFEEKYTPEQIKAMELEQRKVEIMLKLKNFDGRILDKVNLKHELLKIEKKTSIR